ncbi:MAG: glycosyltransferase, partial [Candidatus Ratteibacteria bacterium]
MLKNNIAVIIPTYNERENIIPLVKEILGLNMNIKVIIVDDNSPDGTGIIAKEYFTNNSDVKVFIRKDKRGRGYAGRFGYEMALREKFDIIGEMDGDFSHSPEFIPQMVAYLQHADIVSGSRFLSGARSLRKNFLREMVTRCARIYLRMILGIKLTDPTSGFRFFKFSALSEISQYLKSRDAFIVTEVFYYAFKKHL